jgi:hypothetical protein
MSTEEMQMTAHDEKAADKKVPGGHPENTAPQAGTEENDACRCKEASKMTPRQLLDLMLNDLAFWNKGHKK